MSGLFLPTLALAQNSAFQLIPSCALTDGGCHSCDMLQLFTNFAQLITILISGVVLITFVWGGILWLTSAGVSDKVQKGKQVITGSIIGLVFVAGGYTIVNFSIAAFLGLDRADGVKLFGTHWAELCKGITVDNGGPWSINAGSSDCTGKSDGVSCAAADCTSGCVCHNQSRCISQCEYQNEKLKGGGYIAFCGTLEACQAEDAQVKDHAVAMAPTTGLCPNYTDVCCVLSPTGSGNNNYVAATCVGASNGIACDSGDPQTPGKCKDEQCINGCDYEAISSGHQGGECFYVLSGSNHNDDCPTDNPQYTLVSSYFPSQYCPYVYDIEVKDTGNGHYSRGACCIYDDKK